jgi:hypothetical protein
LPARGIGEEPLELRAIGALTADVVDILVRDLSALRLGEFAEDVQLVLRVLALVLRAHSSVERDLANGVFHVFTLF